MLGRKPIRSPWIPRSELPPKEPLLVSNVKVQTGKSRPCLVATDSGYSDIDVSARVYPIQGSFIGYQCSKRAA